MLTDWTRVTIAGKPVDLIVPPKALPFALIFLHAESGQTTANNPILTSELNKQRLRCIAPIAPRSWWVDRICSDFDPQITAEKHLLENVVPWIESTWKLKKKSIGVAGIEMGGQGAVRLGFTHPNLFPVTAGIGGAFDFHERYGQGTPLDEMYSSREQCRQDTAILRIPPHDLPQIWFACSPEDRWHRGNDRLHEKLVALGIQHTASLEDPAGNDQFIAPMLSFVVATLERESRRLT
jgi:S-formylglutathione hydrolase FrmB